MDLTLNRFLARGTAAERAAFVPAPPVPASGPDPLYVFWESDTGDTYVWDGAAWQLASSSGAGDVVGPASAVDDRIATFDGVTGKLIQDGGQTIAQVIAAATGGAGDVVGPASSVDDRVATFDGVTGKLLQDGGKTLATVQSDAVTAASAAILPIDLTTDVTGVLPVGNMAARTGVIGIDIDGAGSAITTGVKGFRSVPFACTITAVTLLSTDASATAGSIVIDIWKDAYAAYPPVVGDTITASAKPTLSAANKSVDSTLTGWSTAIAAGDVLGFKVDSATTVTRVSLSLTVTVP